MSQKESFGHLSQRLSEKWRPTGLDQERFSWNLTRHMAITAKQMEAPRTKGLLSYFRYC